MVKYTQQFTHQQDASGVLVSLLLTLNIFHTVFSFSVVNVEQVSAGWGERRMKKLNLAGAQF